MSGSTGHTAQPEYLLRPVTAVRAKMARRNEKTAHCAGCDPGWGAELAGPSGNYLARVGALEALVGQQSPGPLPARVAALEQPSGL